MAHVSHLLAVLVVLAQGQDALDLAGDDKAGERQAGDEDIGVLPVLASRQLRWNRDSVKRRVDVEQQVAERWKAPS